MKSRFIYILLFFGVCLSMSCSSHESSIDYEKIADKITDQTAKRLLKEKDLVLIGTGGGMMNQINMMAMSFNYYKEVNFQEARELVVYAVREYLSDINSNEKIKPYLKNYPFKAKNIQIRIFIYKPNGEKCSPEKLSYVSSIDGNVEYYDSIDYRNPVHEESYEEALKQVSQVSN